ncbi:hypothetical protein ABIB80_002235 [Bradyrhizobium sp. i1.15.2]
MLAIVVGNLRRNLSHSHGNLMEKYNRGSGLCSAKILPSGLVVLSAPPAVIVRPDRTIQYSEAAVIESIGRGVLDAPLSRGIQ